MTSQQNLAASSPQHLPYAQHSVPYQYGYGHYQHFSHEGQMIPHPFMHQGQFYHSGPYGGQPAISGEAAAQQAKVTPNKDEGDKKQPAISSDSKAFAKVTPGDSTSSTPHKRRRPSAGKFRDRLRYSELPLKTR